MATITVDEALERVSVLHALGRFDEAEGLCRKILEFDENNAIALHHLKILIRIRDDRTKDYLLREALRTLVAPFVSPDPIIFDVGANVGRMAAVYRKEIFPNAVMHLFEPAPDLFKFLKEACSDDTKIVVNDVGVGAEDGVARFNLIGSDYGQSSFLSPLELEGGVGHVDVPVTKIDTYCQNNGIDLIDFMKLDVQGYEPECLRGAEGMLAKGAIKFIQTEIIFDRSYERSCSFYDIEVEISKYGYRLLSIASLWDGVGRPVRSVDAIYAAS